MVRRLITDSNGYKRYGAGEERRRIRACVFYVFLDGSRDSVALHGALSTTARRRSGAVHPEEKAIAEAVQPPF